MKKTLLHLLGLAIALTPLGASAGLDNKTDSFGVYFDNAGNTTTKTVGVFTPFPVYLLLMNPTGTLTDAFECTVTPTGAPVFILGTDLGPVALDIDASANGFAVGRASPYPIANDAIVLVTWSFMVQAPTPLEFRITQATMNSIPGSGVPVVSGGGLLRPCQVSTCDVTLPVAAVNSSYVPIICDDPPLPTDLHVGVTATCGDLQDSRVLAATTAVATDDYDGNLDIPKPAPPPGNYVQASFEHVGWPLGPRFRADVRRRYDPLAAYQTWPLMVETDRSGDIVLTFDSSLAQSDGALLYLRDLQSGQFFNLFPDLRFVFTNNGLPNTHRFELLVGAAPVPPALNPATRDLPVGWSMVGMPLTPNAGATVGTLLTGPAPGYAFVYDFLPTQGYGLRQDTDAVYEGAGYWLATDTAFTWSAPGTRNLDGVTRGLHNGWNLISYANWFPGPVEGLRVIRYGVTYDWQTAAQMGLVSADVQSFDPAGGSYVEVVNLQPWYGYWINALQPDLSLKFYWGNFVQLPKRLTTDKSALDPDDDSWQSDLTLVDAAGQRRTITLGMNTHATAGFDAQHDKPQPPQSPAGGPLLMFNRPEWELAAGNDESVSWTVVLSSPNPGRAALTWDPKEWPEGVDFQLYLPHENRVAIMSMRKQTTYTTVLGSMATQVVVRTPSFTSSVDAPVGTDFGVSVSPNPFNPQTTVAFDLPQAARAEVRVYSVRGELVAVLGGGSYGAGRHLEVWRGVDRQGHEVPSGSYFARLHVDGKAKGPVTKMSLVR